MKRWRLEQGLVHDDWNVVGVPVWKWTRSVPGFIGGWVYISKDKRTSCAWRAVIRSEFKGAGPPVIDGIEVSSG